MKVLLSCLVLSVSSWLLAACTDSIGHINLPSDASTDRSDVPEDLQSMVGPGTCPSGSRLVPDAGCVCLDRLKECTKGGRRVCVNTSSDPLHCGDCARPCARGFACLSARCVCPTRLRSAVCNGECVEDLWLSDRHCGACGNPCREPMHCFMGVCGAMATEERREELDGGQGWSSQAR